MDGTSEKILSAYPKDISILEIKGKNLPHSLINNRHNLKSIA